MPRFFWSSNLFIFSFKTSNKKVSHQFLPVPQQQMLKTLSFKCSLRETKSVFSLILLKELQQGILPNFRDYVTWRSFCMWFITITTILGRSYSHSKLTALIEPSFSYFSLFKQVNTIRSGTFSNNAQILPQKRRASQGDKWLQISQSK